METIIALLWVAGIIGGLLVGIKFILFRLQRAKTKQDLECHLANFNNPRYVDAIPAVKALLLIRGHFLPKELRVAAQNWIDEIEEKERPNKSWDD